MARLVYESFEEFEEVLLGLQDEEEIEVIHVSCEHAETAVTTTCTRIPGPDTDRDNDTWGFLSTAFGSEGKSLQCLVKKDDLSYVFEKHLELSHWLAGMTLLVSDNPVWVNKLFPTTAPREEKTENTMPEWVKEVWRKNINSAVPRPSKADILSGKAKIPERKPPVDKWRCGGVTTGRMSGPNSPQNIPKGDEPLQVHDETMVYCGAWEDLVEMMARGASSEFNKARKVVDPEGNVLKSNTKIITKLPDPHMCFEKFRKNFLKKLTSEE